MIYSEILKRARQTDGCWEWSGARLASGYGSVRFMGKNRVVHHVTWEQERGPIPAGLDLDHLCRNRACFNPDHLEPVTRTENLRRGANGFGLTGQCRSGRHEITEDNLYIGPRGGRACRECRDERRHEHYLANSVATSPRARERTCCPVGHEYSEANTYVRPNGHRQCRTCRKAQRAAFYQRTGV